MINTSVKNVLLLSVVIIISLTFSCKKTEEIDIPVVSYNYPHENSVYSVGDTIKISVSINSKSVIKSISFGLVDESLNPVLSTHSYEVDGTNSMDIDFSFPIDNYKLESGNYQILCNVSNEKDNKRKYQPILVSAITRELLDVAVVTKLGSHIKVWSLGSTLNKTPELKFDIISDYSGSVYIPYNNRFAIAGAITGDLIVWDYKTGDTVQRILSQSNPPFPYFSSVSSIGDLLAVGYYNEEIKSYYFSGEQKAQVNLQPGYYPSRIIDINDYFLIEQKKKSGINRILSLYSSANSSLHATFDLNGKIVNAFPFEGKDFMVFFNVGDKGNIEKYIYTDNATTEPVSYSGDKINSVTQINAKKYILSTQNHLLYYDYSVSSVSSITMNYNFSKIKYDEISKAVFACENNKVMMLTVPSVTITGNSFVGEEILDIQLIYNY